MKISLPLTLALLSMVLTGCGNSSPALTCQTTSCSSGAQTYQVCSHADGSVSYNFGGMSCTCNAGNTSQCQSCAMEVANYCGGGGGGAGGGGGGGAGGGGGGGGGGVSCTYTVSGAATASGDCTVQAAYQASNSEVDVTLTGSGGQPTFGAALVGKSTLATGTYTLADAPAAGGTYLMGTTSLWAMCNNNMCTDGQGNQVANQGTFTLMIGDPGPATNGILWTSSHGSLVMTLPADPNTTASGTATVMATF